MDWVTKITRIERETGKSIADIARCLEVNSRYIYELKNGKNKNPSASFVQSLFLNLGINPEWLFTDEGSVFITDKVDQRIEANGEETVKEAASRRLKTISSEIDSIADKLSSIDDLPEKTRKIVENILLLDDDNLTQIDIEVRAFIRQQAIEASKEKESQKRAE